LDDKRIQVPDLLVANVALVGEAIVLAMKTATAWDMKYVPKVLKKIYALNSHPQYC
jgi:hypothetical protein